VNYYIIFGVTYALAAALQPGPLQTYILSQTLNKGFRSSLPIAFAPIISDIPIFIVVFLIFNKMPPQFLNIIRIIGGLFLFYIAYKIYLSWKYYSEQTQNNKSVNSFFGAVTINLLNPNPYIGWSLVMGPIFIEAWNKIPTYAIALVVSFYSTMILSLIVIIFLFSFTKSIGPKVTRTLLGLSAVGLFLFGIFQIYKGIIT